MMCASSAFKRNVIVRRSLVFAGLLCTAGSMHAATNDRAGNPWPMVDRDPVKLELVMQLVVTCTNPESIGGTPQSKDGKRTEIWPIVGGRFEGKGIRGVVVPGGGDFPVLRPDGVEVIDALYRLRTDDGVTIIIHNVGLTYPGSKSGDERYRLAPQFIAPTGKYDWLNRNIFVATLTDVPKGMEQARGPTENDRLIQVYRVY
jgi:Protein of unknown function (DUF3237)